MPNKTHDDTFELYDLKVEVAEPRFEMVCSHKVGDYFLVEGENLIFPRQTAFSQYALAALLPILPAKQRQSAPNDWMTTDALIACPDPNCGALFRISRTGVRTFRHSDCTIVPLKLDRHP